VVDVFGRIGPSRRLVRAGNGDQMDVDLHRSLQMGAAGERS
jgi:hypothetical protein